MELCRYSKPWDYSHFQSAPSTETMAGQPGLGLEGHPEQKESEIVIADQADVKGAVPSEKNTWDSFVKSKKNVIATLLLTQPIRKENTGEKIQNAKRRMFHFTQDLHFVRLHDIVSDMVANNRKESIKSAVFEHTSIGLPLDVIEKIIRVNIAIAFENLAENLSKNKANIPDYNKQTALVNTFVLISQKIQKQVKVSALTELQANLREKENISKGNFSSIHYR